MGTGSDLASCPVPGVRGRGSARRRAALGLGFGGTGPWHTRGTDTTQGPREPSGPRGRGTSRALWELIRRFLMERKLF